MKLDRGRWILVILVVLALMLFSYMMGQISVAASAAPLVRKIAFWHSGNSVRLVENALALVRNHYVTPIQDERELIYGALEGMMNRLHRPPYNDPYSAFLGPALWQTLSAATVGSYAGVGIIIGLDPDHPYPSIAAVFPDSPANEAGLLENDLIIAVDDRSTQDQPLEEVARMIMGEPGTQVKLTLMRVQANTPIEITCERAVIEVHSVIDVSLKERHVGYLRITNFGVKTPEEVEKAMKDLLAEDADSLVIDLRNNSGGLLDAAIQVADLFVPEGMLTVLEQRGAPPKEFHADPARTKYHVPLVLLVNRKSASASEVLAGALKDHGLATVVGETTFGKGVVEQVQAIGDGEVGIALTIGKYLTPNGHDLNGEGIEPDVRATFEELISGEPQLTRLNEHIESARHELATESGELMKLFVERQLAIAERTASELARSEKEEPTSKKEIETPAA